MVLFSFGSNGANVQHTIDFNYPQNVASVAIEDLNRAIASGNGEQTVDALVRYSIAQSGISQSNMADIISRIDSTLALQQQPHIRALLSYLQAELYNSYRNRYVQYDRQNPITNEFPSDVSEWDNHQFNNRIDQLLQQALSDPDALKRVRVTSLPSIIRCDELGSTYEPTLLEFLCDKCLNLMDDNIMVDSCRSVDQLWKDCTIDNVPAHIYALCEIEGYKLDIYDHYRDNEHSGYVLRFLDEDDSNNARREAYQRYKEYVQRFPNAPYANDIRNRMINLERKRVVLSYPEVRSSLDSISVMATIDNVTTFAINVYRVPDQLIDKYDFKLSDLKLVGQQEVSVQGNVPFHTEYTVSLPPLGYGCYVIVPSFVQDQKQVTDSTPNRYDLLRVTDLGLFWLAQRDDEGRVAVVNLATGEPRESVNVVGEYRHLKGHGVSTSRSTNVTDNQGMVIVPASVRNATMHATCGADQYSEQIVYHNYPSSGRDIYEVEFYTDLGVYRPGETVQWAAVLHTTPFNGNKRHVVADERVKIEFMDQNDELIDTVQLTSDAYGRVEGSFVVPTDRMNGIFRIHLTGITNNRISHWHQVNVSEYKTPTFVITFLDQRRNQVVGQPVTIRGKVETYSGMPIASTQVRLALKRNQWSWWRLRASNGTIVSDTIVTTDAQGNFSITMPTDWFDENVPDEHGKRYRWSRYNYSLIATVTNAAGETQEETADFIVGTRRGIELQCEEYTLINDGPITLDIQYNTTDEQHPATLCTWQLIHMQDNQLMKSGNFSTDKPIIDVTNVPSGQYLLKVHILDADEGEQDVDAEATLTLFRTTDEVPPISDCPLWAPQVATRIDKHNIGHITIGVSSPQAHIYCVVEDYDGIISQGWLHYDKGMHEYTVSMPDEDGGDVRVHLISYYNTHKWEELIKLQNNRKQRALNIYVTSFRDRLVPGEHEHWTFSLQNQNGVAQPGAMLLDMYDKAISTIADNDWQFSQFAHAFNRLQLSAQQTNGRSQNHAQWMASLSPALSYEIPYLYTYDQEFFSTHMGRPSRYYKAMAASRSMAMGMETSDAIAMGANGIEEEQIMMSVAAPEAALNEVEDEESVAVNEARLRNVILRESDIKTALWLPMLTSDDKGNVSVEFDAPQFNTTWLVQAVAYNQEVYGTSLLREVLTQKPLMVRNSLPRFVRHGDKVMLAASVQNATDTIVSCDAVIELFDPRSGNIYARRTFSVQLAPHGTNALTISWQIPDTLAWVGFRVKAIGDNYGDGEQVMLPVLSTISPVIETQPFYIEATQSHFELPLPQFDNNARVTLEYCDNPVWYCVTALPTIFDDNYNLATAVAHSLFALQVAQGVAKSQPQIREAIDYWTSHSEDSMLVSMLQKNQDLKIGTLLASPWLRDAERQTLRMSQLAQLFDEQAMSQEYEKIVAALQLLQMADGGWTWFRHNGCKSSVWVTGVVLELIGEIQQLGYLPTDSRLKQMIERAVAYYDSENLRLLNQALKYNTNPYSQFAGYAYVRSLFKDVKQSTASVAMLKKVLAHMNKEWNRGINLRDKAYYAMTLHRAGYSKTACDIVESVRQFAITTPQMGMYWDNLQTAPRGNGWDLDKVAYTSTMLQAMNEVDPHPDEIDRVRKWMLLMKQSNDWGTRSLAADAVYSLLHTGSQWLERNSTPTIMVAGQPIDMDRMAQYVGYLRANVPATAVGAVTIDRNGKSPAWGAVYSQYSAPMTAIQAVAIDEVSIDKDYYVYAADGTLHAATSFKVGDKVQVRMVIKVLKDMDYVTIVDERAACFEPVDQLSGCRVADGDWYYHETKDAQTNLFFHSLVKGTHVINYDVWVTGAGEFTSGIATIQCQYAPQLTAHSAGKRLHTTK